MKPDAENIGQFLEKLVGEDWLRRTERRWWPRFVFHYTDIRNAVEVLREGCLYSRRYLEQAGKLLVSSGSTIVLSGTRTSVKDCVRLYFRPKTPTQYHAEGIYSKTELSKSKYPDAHCPVPVFFLFNAVEVLSRDDCWFSDGNLGSPASQVFSTAAELEQLPWTKIYHTGRYNRQSLEESDIAFRRNAEVIVPRKLDLGALSYIYCRSDAERETLLFLLPPYLKDQYESKIVSSTRSDLFYRRQTFIETVGLSSDGAYFQFSPETQSHGPFHLKVKIKIGATEDVLEREGFSLEGGFKWKIPIRATHYTVKLFLDNHLAYANAYRETEIPF